MGSAHAPSLNDNAAARPTFRLTAAEHRGGTRIHPPSRGIAAGGFMGKCTHLLVTTPYCPHCGALMDGKGAGAAILAYFRALEKRCNDEADGVRTSVRAAKDPRWAEGKVDEANRKAERWKVWADWVEDKMKVKP